MIEFIKSEDSYIIEGPAGRHFNAIKIEELKLFAREVLIFDGDNKKLKEANDVIDILLGMLKQKNQLNENGMQSFVEMMVVAGLVHNVYFDSNFENQWVSLFMLRELHMETAIKNNVPPNAYNAIFQTVEAQLGDKTPIPACLPVPNSPTELFSWAVWFNRKYAWFSKNESD